MDAEKLTEELRDATFFTVCAAIVTWLEELSVEGRNTALEMILSNMPYINRDWLGEWLSE